MKPRPMNSRRLKQKLSQQPSVERRSEPDRELWPNDKAEWIVTIGLFCVFGAFLCAFIIEAVALTVSIIGIIGSIIALVHIATEGTVI